MTPEQIKSILDKFGAKIFNKVIETQNMSNDLMKAELSRNLDALYAIMTKSNVKEIEKDVETEKGD